MSLTAWLSATTGTGGGGGVREIMDATLTNATRYMVQQLSVALPSFVWDDWRDDQRFAVNRAG